MRNIYVLLLVIAGLLWGAGIFLGFVSGVGKGFQNQPSIDSSESQKLKQKQDQIIDDAEYQRKQFMDDYKQKMRDLREL